MTRTTEGTGEDLVLSLPASTVPLIFLGAIPAAEWRRPGRAILLVSSGANVTRAQRARIPTRSSALAFLPERIIIGGDASDWIIHDILIGERSQVRVRSTNSTDPAESDETEPPGIPGEVFGQEVVGGFFYFETVQTAMNLTFVVSYVGSADAGAPFCCAVLGTAA